MNRRSFLHCLGSSVALPLRGLLSSSMWLSTEAGIDQLLKTLVQYNDDRMATLLASQEQDKRHPWWGGSKNPDGIHSAQLTGAFIKTLTSSWVAPSSAYYHSPNIAEALQMAARYLLAAQHDDGTVDLYSTNFHSPPDTAFTVDPVSQAYAVLSTSKAPVDEALLADLKTFLIKAGGAMAVGGIHTPNHRWVVSMALARIHTLFPNAAYTERIDAWLQEGIDIDEDGQYTEQSTLTYTPLVDRWLITIARLLDKPELLESVRRNLEMSLYYLHANGEVVTEGSSRQDKDKYQRGSMAKYYYAYRYMALLDRNPRFAAMARYLEAHDTTQLTQWLLYFWEDPTLATPLPVASSLPTHYTKVFSGSQLARIRRGSVDATVLAENPVFFTFFKNKAALEGIRLATAFFGKGQFEGEALEEESGRFHLQQHLTGPYFQPYPIERLPDDGDWEKMPYKNRAHSEVQQLHYQVSVQETDAKFTIRIRIEGTDHVPVAVELAFRTGGQLEGVTALHEEMADEEKEAERYLLEDGFGTYRYEETTIRFGPGKAAHRWVQLRGALPKLEAQSVYLTGYTPFEHELVIS